MKLLFFPGIGADHRLFNYQIEGVPGFEVPQWIPPTDSEPLSDYGARYAEHLARVYSSSKHQEPIVLGGMSFGGQVALEVSRRWSRVKGVFLVAANRRASEIPGQFRAQQKFLERLPDMAVKVGLKNFALPMVKKKENLREREVEWLKGMVDDLNLDFFRWSIKAAATWDYEFRETDFLAPIFQIRGEYDSVIKFSDPNEAEVLQGAGHFINYTHGPELNQWILQKKNLVS
jgi:pimeloyl-ACP methyl ester carboxylesterase